MKTKARLLSLGIAGFTSLSAWAGSENGSAGDMPAYYDHKLFTVNFKELPTGGEQANLLHNKSINVIFMSDAGLPGGEPFVAVLDAIQGDGFNPLWFEVQINFVPGHPARQLFSDNEVAEAFEAGEITVNGTGELYRCAVVGPK
jgi:hypothetical protein